MKDYNNIEERDIFLDFTALLPHLVTRRSHRLSGTLRLVHTTSWTPDRLIQVRQTSRIFAIDVSRFAFLDAKLYIITERTRVFIEHVF